MKTNFIILLVCGIFATSLLASTEFEETWEEARHLYYSSLQQEAHLTKALSLFETLSEKDDKLGVAQTYIGSLTAVKAQYTPWPHKKLQYANKGLDIMDDGLQKNPDDLEALFIHGTTSYYLPFFFNRRDDANRSFKRILELLPQRLEQQDPEMAQNILNFILENADINETERQTAIELKSQLEIS